MVSSNDLSSQDDRLVIENAGNFGQRLHDDDNNSDGYSSSTIQNEILSSGYARVKPKIGKAYFPNDVVSSTFSSFNNNNNVVGQTENSIIAEIYSSGVSFASSPSSLSYVTNNDNNIYEKKEYVFAKPIVVPDSPNQKEIVSFQYSTTFKCENEEDSTTNPIQNLNNEDMSSSRILNPIQAGVVLVNAGDFLVNSYEKIPAPVNEKIEDIPQLDQASIQPLANVIGNQEINYQSVNPAFGGQQQQLDNLNQTTEPPIVIQKSIEVYQNTSRQRIYDQAAVLQNAQQQLLLNNPSSNAYPKDTNINQPIYLVPPATYVLEDSLISKNSLSQEKIPQYLLETTSSTRIPNENYQNKKTDVSYKQQSYGNFVEKGLPLKVPQVKPVGYKIEKVVEKKIPVPVIQPIPIPVEKKVPIPVHIPVPVEKIIEKPIHIPIPVEKIIEKKIPIPQPYPVKIEKIIERKVPYPIEVTKYVEKPTKLAVHQPYGVHYGVSYQQIMKPQNPGLYKTHTNNLLPFYALNNHNQSFQGYTYEKPLLMFNEIKKQTIDGKNNIFLLNTKSTKKFPYNSYSLPHSNSLLLHRRHASVNQQNNNKQQRDDYFGPVPPIVHHLQQQQQQRQFGFQTKAIAPYSIDRTQNSRQARNHEPVSHRYQKGNFRQSKIEYGFKPPMVPSVQYDEETASKVES